MLHVFCGNLVNVIETLFCQVDFRVLKITFNLQSKMLLFFCYMFYYPKLYNLFTLYFDLCKCCPRICEHDG